MTTFDADGWQTDAKLWDDKYGHHVRGETLPAFLVATVGVPLGEAGALAEEITGHRWAEEWERRGGAEEARKIERFTFALTAALVVGGALALIGVALLVWVLAT